MIWLPHIASAITVLIASLPSANALLNLTVDIDIGGTESSSIGACPSITKVQQFGLNIDIDLNVTAKRDTTASLSKALTNDLNKLTGLGLTGDELADLDTVQRLLNYLLSESKASGLPSVEKRDAASAISLPISTTSDAELLDLDINGQEILDIPDLGTLLNTLSSKLSPSAVTKRAILPPLANELLDVDINGEDILDLRDVDNELLDLDINGEDILDLRDLETLLNTLLGKASSSSVVKRSDESTKGVKNIANLLEINPNILGSIIDGLKNGDLDLDAVLNLKRDDESTKGVKNIANLLKVNPNLLGSIIDGLKNGDLDIDGALNLKRYIDSAQGLKSSVKREIDNAELIRRGLLYPKADFTLLAVAPAGNGLYKVALSFTTILDGPLNALAGTGTVALSGLGGPRPNISITPVDNIFKWEVEVIVDPSEHNGLLCLPDTFSIDYDFSSLPLVTQLLWDTLFGQQYSYTLDQDFSSGGFSIDIDVSIQLKRELMKRDLAASLGIDVTLLPDLGILDGKLPNYCWNVCDVSSSTSSTATSTTATSSTATESSTITSTTESSTASDSTSATSLTSVTPSSSARVPPTSTDSSAVESSSATSTINTDTTTGANTATTATTGTATETSIETDSTIKTSTSTGVTTNTHTLTVIPSETIIIPTTTGTGTGTGTGVIDVELSTGVTTIVSTGTDVTFTYTTYLTITLPDNGATESGTNGTGSEGTGNGIGNAASESLAAVATTVAGGSGSGSGSGAGSIASGGNDTSNRTTTPQTFPTIVATGGASTYGVSVGVILAAALILV